MCLQRFLSRSASASKAAVGLATTITATPAEQSPSPTNTRPQSSTNVSFSAVTASSESSPLLSGGAIAGIVVGALACAALAAVAERIRVLRDHSQKVKARDRELASLAGITPTLVDMPPPRAARKSTALVATASSLQSPIAGTTVSFPRSGATLPHPSRRSSDGAFGAHRLALSPPHARAPRFSAPGNLSPRHAAPLAELYLDSEPRHIPQDVPGARPVRGGGPYAAAASPLRRTSDIVARTLATGDAEYRLGAIDAVEVGPDVDHVDWPAAYRDEGLPVASRREVRRSAARLSYHARRSNASRASDARPQPMGVVLRNQRASAAEIVAAQAAVAASAGFGDDSDTAEPSRVIIEVPERPPGMLISEYLGAMSSGPVVDVALQVPDPRRRISGASGTVTRAALPPLPSPSPAPPSRRRSQARRSRASATVPVPEASSEAGWQADSEGTSLC